MESSIPQPPKPGPLTDDYLRAVQARVVDTRHGPWDVVLADDGQPVGFGPFSWVEEWHPDELIPAVEFCRHARTDVPALLGEIARLKTQLRLLDPRTVPVGRRV
jgi:hypothetical protein